MSTSLIKDALATVDLLESEPSRREQLIDLVGAACAQSAGAQSLPAIQHAVDQVLISTPATPYLSAAPEVLTKVPTTRKEWLAFVAAPYHRPASAQVWVAITEGLSRLEKADEKRFLKWGRVSPIMIFTGLALALGSFALTAGHVLPSPVAGGLAALGMLSLIAGAVLGHMRYSATPFFGDNELSAKVRARYKPGEPVEKDIEGWATHPDLARCALSHRPSSIPLLKGDILELRKEFADRENAQRDQVAAQAKLAVWETIKKNAELA